MKPREKTKVDEALAARVREVLGPRRDLLEKRMFGGLAFMVGGHMTVGINGESLMVRTGPGGMDEALAQPHARPMDFTGKPLKGFVYVDPPGVESEAQLASWIDRALAFTASLPAK